MTVNFPSSVLTGLDENFAMKSVELAALRALSFIQHPNYTLGYAGLKGSLNRN